MNLTHISKLKLPFKTKFYTNKRFKKTGCAYSFIIASKFLKNDVLIINSDLILNQKKISNILYNNKSNFVYLRKPLANKKKRPVKAKLFKKKIIKISISKKNSDLEVVGPFKLSLISVNKLKEKYKSLDKYEFSKMSCYSFFGKIVKDINLYYQILNDADWYEINTTKEYNESFKNRIFKAN